MCVAADVSDVDYAVRAEQLGYTHPSVADSQMLVGLLRDARLDGRTDRADPARHRRGRGGHEDPPAVLAAAMATINRLAPGRVFCGVGSGNTAMRIMGHRPVTIAELDRYLGELRPLLAGDEVELSWRGRTAPTCHLMPDHGFVDFRDPIPVYVSGFGPRSMGLAGRHGDGLILGGAPGPGTIADLWDAVEAGAAAAGRVIDRSSFGLATLTTMVVLEPGEDPTGACVREEAGAFAIASLHYAYEQWNQYGQAPPRHLAPIWDEYLASVEAVPTERRHLHVHRGHDCWVEPDEERFVTPELIAASCLVGTPDQLAERVRDLGAAGLTQVVLLPPLAVKDKVLTDVATKVAPLL